MKSRAHITPFFTIIVLALMVSAFTPVPMMSSEQIFTVEMPRASLSTPSATLNGPTNPEDLEAFLDPLVTELMETNHVPGGAIAVVKDGQLFFTQGYGYADLESQTPATADSTIFRVGSVSKVLTWTAVMQLVEQGKLDLNADVNTYLTHFQIPATFDQPITIAQLMTHTAGFEDQITNGAVYASAEGYQPLQNFLAEKMPARIFPPGEIVAYSNYGASLAGEIVAEVSGESFEQYVAHHILQPLEMNHSTFLQPLPPDLIQNAATGYEIDENGMPHAGLFELVQAEPAGALSATAIDMAHFMIAHLQDGQFGNERILQASSAQDMRRQYYAFNPQLPGMTRGFAEAYRNNFHFVFHPGTTDLSASLLVLLPDQNLGIFMTFNSYISTPPRLALINAVIDHYYPASIPVVDPRADFSQSAARFTGNYISSRRAETNIDKLVAPISSEVSVVSNPDKTLSVEQFRDSSGTPIHWAEVSPLVFQEVGGQRFLAFSTDTEGHVTAMFSGDQPILIFQKLAWYENPRNHLAGLGLSLLIFIVTIILWLSGGLLRLVRQKSTPFTPLERWGRSW
jgi:CubicO group peptidase (beta-lactamase class C family)